MSRIYQHLIVSCGIALCAAAPLHAQVSDNVLSEVFVTGGMQSIPGQTVDYEGVTTSVNGTGAFPSFGVSCGINVAGVGCSVGGVPAVTNVTQSPLSGVSYSASANLFNNSTSVSMSVTGAPTTALTAPLSIGVTAGEFQQLEIQYSGILPAPTNVVLDMTYNLNTTLTDNTTGSTADTSGSYASVSVADPQTFNATPDANGYPTIELPFLAVTSQGNLEASGAPSALGETDPVPLALNHPYWVELFAQAGVALPLGSTDDFSVTLSASADPTFSIDATWLAANPQFTASDFSISQSYETAPVAVPEPPVVWLLLTGFGAVTLTARSRRGRRHVLVD